jgi:type IV pilus assembly protein PilC
VSDGGDPTIGTLTKASRYLFELTTTVPFDEAIQRVQSHADAAVGRELETLQRYVAGQATAKPAAELALYAELLKRAPDKARVATGVASLNESLAEARLLADETRGGWPADLAYSALLLAVATLIATVWLLYVAPEFEAMFLGFGATLPALSRAIFDNAWLIFAPLLGLALALVWLVAGARRLAAAMETLSAPPPSLAPLFGARATQAHEPWRTAALASAWVGTGLSPVDALREASAQATAGAAGKLAGEIALAAKIGLAAHELLHQRRAALAECRAALELRRTLTLRALQIVIAIVVGAIVIAVYQPIFQMGAVI